MAILFNARYDRRTLDGDARSLAVSPLRHATHGTLMMTDEDDVFEKHAARRRAFLSKSVVAPAVVGLLLEQAARPAQAATYGGETTPFIPTFTDTQPVTTIGATTSPVTTTFLGTTAPVTTTFIATTSPLTTTFIGTTSPVTTTFIATTSPMTTTFIATTFPPTTTLSIPTTTLLRTATTF
ncbi:MAG: hypothetical protein ABI277_17385 [Burkholderiaceae bacterium]